ncbi:MAG: enoyl-CoA hydratase/isomerase family protein, partial [Acidobacteria bacterium]|nr:enoyl-CoA hydratase/isomerase family protein [Acidobacteriota bacterium]
MSDPVLISVDGDVATITLNRPEAMNALDLEMADKLAPAIEEVAFDSRVRAVMLEGAGANFMAGGDVKVFLEHLGHGTHDDLVDAVRAFQRAAKLMRRAPKPILAKDARRVRGRGH